MSVDHSFLRVKQSERTIGDGEDYNVLGGSQSIFDEATVKKGSKRFSRGIIREKGARRPCCTITVLD